ncbi:hypothetical protein H2200_001030 [Cladophialophora chaetospira]|uniref:Uncharacterized protein n=1 Tax=Cladophialophora chaetospira TaxID=386627 RepID=A0AA38XQN4_9EURO|nr:hypothetical protein H2200_001030 [Cladophialophora chaetospira]
MASNTSHSLLCGSAILIIWGSQNNLSISEERELNDWWTNEHIPERLAIPGFHRTRRYYYSSEAADSEDASSLSKTKSASQSQRISHYLVLYEVASLGTLTSQPYMAALNNPTPGTKKYLPFLASMNRSACRVLLSVSRPEFSTCQRGGVGGTFARVDLFAPASASQREELISWLRHDGWEMLIRFFKSSILAIHLLEHDDEASKSGSSTKSYTGLDVPASKSQPAAGSGGEEVENERKWMLLVEFTDAFDAPYASYKERCLELATGLTERGVDLKRLKEEIYGLVVVMEE